MLCAKSVYDIFKLLSMTVLALMSAKSLHIATLKMAVVNLWKICLFLWFWRYFSRRKSNSAKSVIKIFVCVSFMKECVAILSYPWNEMGDQRSNSGPHICERWYFIFFCINSSPHSVRDLRHLRESCPTIGAVLKCCTITIPHNNHQNRLKAGVTFYSKTAEQSLWIPGHQW